jgi:uncharacterized protein (DUF433 family)
MPTDSTSAPEKISADFARRTQPADSQIVIHFMVQQHEDGCRMSPLPSPSHTCAMMTSTEADMSDVNEIDWSLCPDVESVPGRCSGAWVVKDSRILVEGVLDNYDDGASPEEIGEEILAGLGADRARRIIAYARSRVGQPVPHA